MLFNNDKYINNNILQGENKNSSKVNISNNILYFKEYIKNLNNVNARIGNRCIVLYKDNLLIGNNKKQLENNYYDLKISVDEKDSKFIKIYINKLFKDYNSNIYDSNYLDEIVKFLNVSFKFDLNETELIQLRKYILDKYLYVRNNIVEKLEDNEILKFSNISMTSSLEENIIVFNISN